MLFTLPAALGLFALQVVALPTGGSYSIDSRAEPRQLLPRIGQSDSGSKGGGSSGSGGNKGHKTALDDLDTSGSDGDNLVNWIKAIVDLAASLHAYDMDAREKMLRGGLEIMERDRPQSDGWHHFIFLQHKGFYYNLQTTDFFEETHEYKRKDLAGSTERFKFVSFKGSGFLDKNGHDGGWANWAYDGGHRDGERVSW